MPTAPNSIDEEIVPVIAEACDFIRANPEVRHSLAALSRKAGMSPGHFQRQFKRVVGVSPRQFAEACRLDHFKGEIKGGKTVTGAMIAAGFGSSSRLYERAAEHLGMTPGEYGKGGAVALRFATAECTLGVVLLAGTDRGISAVFLADTPDELIELLRDEFPAATLRRDDTRLTEWLQDLLRRIEGNEPHRQLPLDVRATAFQRRVWQELQAIPLGETRTYQQVAAAIGKPTATRAVARACATNPVSVVIPCHRVVGTNGSLTGYRWGVGRKKKLLDAEKQSRK
jgi:AraC family transcriptional regulator of adaptative response/methylated-DNA-[protein]-cysteine methyltransferase